MPGPPALPADAIRLISVADLALDRENPRLPELARVWSDSDLVAYLRDNYAIDEIIDSMLSNGFFTQEPLLVLQEPDPTSGRYVVVEGNRRLASLMYIHGVVDEDYFDEAPTDQQIQRLDRIPCVLVESRDAVRTYLGFRHIGGIKDWSPEAKARFVRTEVERQVAAGTPRPFYAVGRAYGSNSQGIRNAYIALMLLIHAREEFGIDVHYVQHERFGVWQRLLNSGTVREYIGFGKASTYEEIQVAIREVAKQRLLDVIGDLTPKSGATRALLNDSRQITDYGRVLTDEHATEVLRRHGDLDVAVQVVRNDDLPGRIQRLASGLSALVDEVVDAPLSEPLERAVENAYRAARKMRTELQAKESE